MVKAAFFEINRSKDRGPKIYTLMNHTKRSSIKPGLKVKIVMKEDQRSGYLTEGYVQDILTNSSSHPHGIKVRLETGEVGRVQEIMDED